MITTASQIGFEIARKALGVIQRELALAIKSTSDGNRMLALLVPHGTGRGYG